MIVRPHRGLAARPPVRYILKLRGEVLSFSLPRGAGTVATLKSLVVVVIVAALGFSAGGWSQYHDATTGPKVSATVTECHHVTGLHGGSTACTGSWVAGGSLLAHGHVVLGTINGVGYGEVGKRVTVRLHGDTAYTPSIRTAIVLFCIAFAMLLIGIWFIWAMATGRATSSRRRTRSPTVADSMPTTPQTEGITD